MTTLSTPLIGEPVFACAKLIIVSGCVPGAEVTFFAVAKDTPFSSSITVGVGQASGTSPQVYAIDDTKITEGTRLYAIQRITQEDGTVQESPHPDDEGANIQYAVVQKALSVETPRVDEPLLECALCIRVRGILPGATVEVLATVGQDPRLRRRRKTIGQTSSFASDADVGVEPLQPNQSVTARQWLCDPQDKSTASLAIAVNPVTKQDKSFLPSPEIAEPVFPCQEFIVVNNCLPGAQLELFINGAADPDTAACATTQSSVIWLGKPLQENDRLKVRLSLCNGELISADQNQLPEVKVSSSQLLPQPRIALPLYEGDTLISLQGTIPGEIVTIIANDEQIGMGGAGTTLSMLPVKKDMRVVAKVTLCDGMAVSRPVYVKPLPHGIPPPEIHEPVYACTQTITLTHCFIGARIKLIAAAEDSSQMLIGSAQASSEKIDITSVVFLKAGWQIYATQQVGGSIINESHKVPVRDSGSLPDFKVHKKLFTCAHCLTLDNIVPGARVNVYQDNRWIGGAYANKTSVHIDISLPLKKVPLISIKQTLCEQTKSITAQVSSDSILRLPTIVDARPDSFSVAVKNIIPGAIVEVSELTRYNRIIGKSSLADTSGRISLQVPLALGDSVIARQTMCEPSGFSPVFPVNQPEYWPLRTGPFAVGSMEVDDITIGSELATKKDNFPFLQNGNLGVIHFPAATTGGNRLAAGSFPLIAFAHAKSPYGIAEAENAGIILRYDYRQLNKIFQHLASWGFICVAASMFWASPSGDSREYLLRDEINYMFAKNHSDPIFQNKIDTSKLAVMGHSTGGWGTVALTTSNTPGLSEVASKIKAVALIAPAMPEEARQLGAQITPKPLMVLDGTQDIGTTGTSGGASGVFGHAAAPKIYLLTTGANHFGYTEDLSYFQDGHPGEILPREEQQNIAKAYLTTFFKRFLKNDHAVEGYLRGNPIESLEGYTIAADPQF